jgi:hypothetical protein
VGWWGHSLLIDGVLMPMAFLVNDLTVLWDNHTKAVGFHRIDRETQDQPVTDRAAYCRCIIAGPELAVYVFV